MHPESSRTSPKFSPDKTFESSQSSTQHGITHQQRQPASSGSSHEVRESAATLQSPVGGNFESVESVIHQLNTAELHNYDDKNLFNGHNFNESIGSSNESDGTREPAERRNGTLKVTHLPNEILIHALSHLSPSDLLSTALVCRHFHRLVTQPDAWRTAFARYFPGDTALISSGAGRDSAERREAFRSDKRVFGRLTALATWRNEYVVRSRLLRSMERGRPLPAPESPHPTGRRQNIVNLSPIVTHDTQFVIPIGRIHTTFDHRNIARGEPVIFAAGWNGEARIFNPITGKADGSWNTWHDDINRRRFEDFYPEHESWGLGTGQVVGNDNPFDISKRYGVVVGEGCPGGRVSLHAIGEHSIQMLQNSSWTFTRSNSTESDEVVSMPRISPDQEGISSVWLAKSDNIPSLSNGVIGIVSGSSRGVVSSYSLGHVGLSDRSMARGQLTARWIVSPGVPIIAIAVDENHSLKRQAQNRIWAVVLNALGEVFYLTKFPRRPAPEYRPKAKENEDRLERLAWVTGRSVYWNHVEPSRRVARLDPYGDRVQDGSYSPRSSWDGMCLSSDQIEAETTEINEYLTRRPAVFRSDCYGWDMQRKMEVDFANDDTNFAGETIVIFCCGLNEEVSVGAKRYMRMRISKDGNGSNMSSSGPATPRLSTSQPDLTETSSIFGPLDSPPRAVNEQTELNHQERAQFADPSATFEDWRTSELSLSKSKGFQVTCVTLDCSKLANITLSEDPLLNLSSTASDSSGTSSPVATDEQLSKPQLIPGQRARFLAAATNIGQIFIWNVRGSVPRTAESAQPIDPIRTIYAPGSLNITCIAMNSLILVHGDDNGLVQAWDPLASQVTPIRTISTPFTGRLRRRVMEAQAQIPDELGLNLSSAGAVALDPDPTVLRGIVTIGSHVKHWHFRADDLGISSRGRKRKLRKGSRGGNSQSGTPTSLPKTGGILGFIEDELRELKLERKREAKHRHRLEQRFGLGMLEEEEGLRLAMLMSEESFDRESSVQSGWSTPRAESVASSTPMGESHDADLNEAIRRSLQDSQDTSPVRMVAPVSPSQSSSPWSGQIRFGHRDRRLPRSQSTSPQAVAGPSRADEASDLELAMMLSMQDQGGSAAEDLQFPALMSGKGKGRE